MSGPIKDKNPVGEESDAERYRAILDRLRHSLGDEEYEAALQKSGEAGLEKLARFMSERQPEPERQIPILRLSETQSTPDLKQESLHNLMSSSTKSPAEVDEEDPLASLHQFRLDRMRRRLGSAAFDVYLEDHSEEQLLALENQLPPLSEPKVSEKKVRTRESSHIVNRVVFLIALWYGLMIGAGYPNWEIFTKGLRLFDNPLVYVGLIGMVIVVFLFFPNFVRIDNETIVYLWILIVGGVIASAISFVINLFEAGVIVPAVAGVAFIFCYLLGMLLGRPVLRLLERLNKIWMKWVFGILAAIPAIVIMVIGWSVVMAVFPVK